MKYNKELLTYLGRFYKDTTIFTFEMFPIRVRNNFDRVLPFIERLEQDGYIKMETNPFILKVLKEIPNYDYLIEDHNRNEKSQINII